MNLIHYQKNKVTFVNAVVVHKGEVRLIGTGYNGLSLSIDEFAKQKHLTSEEKQILSLNAHELLRMCSAQ